MIKVMLMVLAIYVVGWMITVLGLWIEAQYDRANGKVSCKHAEATKCALAWPLFVPFSLVCCLDGLLEKIWNKQILFKPSTAKLKCKNRKQL